MAYSEFQFDPDRIRRQGALLGDLGDRVGGTYAGLRDNLAEADGCWGDDDLGVAFAESFTPGADQLLTNLRAMQESLRETARGLIDATRSVEDADQNIAGRTDRDSGEPSRGDPGPAVGAPQPSQAAPPLTPDANASPAATPASSPPPAAPQTATAEVENSSGGPLSDPSGQPAHTEQPTPDAGPDEAGGQDTPRGVPDSSHPSPGAASPAAGDRRPEERSGSPAAIPPPLAENNSPRARDGLSAGDSRRAAGAGRQATPWTTPPRPAPGAHAAEESSRPPAARSDAPPPRKRGQGRSGRDRTPERPVGRPGASAALGWLARTLAERHGVQVTGFDLPGLEDTAVREFAAAIDRVLTDYPAVVLDRVAVTDLGGGDGPPVRWERESRDDRAPAVRSITLDQSVAGASAPPGLRVYAATVRELASALDSAGAGVVGRRVQRILIAEYLRRAAGRYTSLGEVVRGYRRWRAELNELFGDADDFDIRRALGYAFADVVLHGVRASAQAQVLHAALVAAASPPGRSGAGG
ncbi:WXG100 family type VII secretion target [Nocardia wallacei]|uniref:WXG100 family type VII secretion target n=1 Tax=Nocardia wallacei TaxID=480035 RepID=UPI002458FD5F|nr:hypothetical protein [Nocardia wallacei]